MKNFNLKTIGVALLSLCALFFIGSAALHSEPSHIFGSIGAIKITGASLASSVFSSPRHDKIRAGLDRKFNYTEIKDRSGKSLWKKKGGEQYVPAPHYLRVDAEILNNQSTYKFNMTNTAGLPTTPVERRLDSNDLFVVTDLLIGIVAQDQTKIGKEVIQTYPNQTVFVAAAGTFDPTDLEAIYNGSLYLKTGRKVNIEAESLLKYRHVPQTQQSSGTNKSMFVWREAVHQVEPIYLHGRKENEIKIEIPAFNGILMQAVAANTKNKIVFMPFGYLIKGISADIDRVES